MEAFAAFMEAHDAHGVKEWADTTYDPKSADAVQIQACRPFEHRPGVFVECDFELGCSTCEETLLSRRHRLKPFEPFTATPQETLHFRSRVLEVADLAYKADFPFDEQGTRVHSFLKTHDGHAINVRLIQEDTPPALGAPQKQWHPPEWPVEASERWLGPTSLESLIGLYDRSPQRRCAALASVADPSALGYVVAAFDDPDPSVRSTAALAIARLGDPRGIRALGARLGDASQEVVAAAAAALSTLRVDQEEAKREARTPRGPYGVTSWSAGEPPDGINGIERALRDPRPNVRLGAMAATEVLSDADAIPLILLATFDPSYLIRTESVRQLKKRRHDARCLGALLGLISDISLHVAYQAIEALPTPPPAESLPPVLDAWIAGAGISYAKRVIRALANQDHLALLRGALSHREPRVRAEAVALVAAIGGRSETLHLLPALNDPSLAVRLEGVAAMGELQTPEALKALASLRDRTSRRMRGQAVQVLSSIDTPEARGVLEWYLADPDTYLQRSAAEVLVRSGTPQQMAAAKTILTPPNRPGRHRP